MNNIFKFLRSNFPLDAYRVNRLFVSTFIRFHNLDVQNNIFLQNFIIPRDNKDEYEFVETLSLLLKQEGIVLTFEDLITLFEFVLSPEEKVINGAIYTPQYIREYIISHVFAVKNDTLFTCKIADISCGCGAFLIDVSKKLKQHTNKTYFEIFSENIFGLDIQEYAITRTQILLTLLAISEGEDIENFQFNLHQGDALISSFQEIIPNFDGFDIIVGNPPYACARHLDEQTRENMDLWEVCRIGNPDLYIPFFQIGMTNIAQNGILGFITMNSFFKSLNGRNLRNYFQENRFGFRIIDFNSEQIFKSCNTYTCICFLENNIQEHIEYSRCLDPLSINIIDEYEYIEYDRLNSETGWNLHNNELITIIENTGTPLGNKYKSRHGIATLKNSIYIFTPYKEDKKYYYLKTKNKIYPIEKSICRNIVNSNRLTKDVQVEDIIEKIIFPYTNEKRPSLIKEEYFKQEYPQAYNYLFHNKEVLALRDKGNGKYENWFAFGRSQSLEKTKVKLFFPKISNISPSCLIYVDENLMFYNGQAMIDESKDNLSILKKIMESRIFWHYIESTSKPYSSNYYSLNGNYVKNFGIPDFDDVELNYIRNESNSNALNDFFERKYGIRLQE